MKKANVMKRILICSACGIVAIGTGLGGALSFDKAYAAEGVVYYDVLTDEKFYSLWDNDMTAVNEFLMEGGTIGGINYEKVTGDFKETSSNGVVAGGETVDKNAGDFSVVIMGDQQSAVEYHSAYVASSYNWIVENADEMNLKMYINLGDIVDDTQFLTWRQPSGNTRSDIMYNKYRMGNWKMQLQFASNQWKKLFNAGIPSAMVMGNHDYEDMAESYRVKDNFKEYFPVSSYDPYKLDEGEEISTSNYYGGTLYNDIEACYYYFTGRNADDKYMVITLGTYPTDEMLAWASEVVEANEDCKVIVATHSYFQGGNTGDRNETGQYVWNNFVSQHENIVMTACGHECTDDGSVIKRVDYGKNGNPVTQFMINPQKEEFGGAGMFAQLIFRADGSIDFVYYSPYVAENNGKGYFRDDNQFTFTLNPEKLTANTQNEAKAKNTLSKTTSQVYYMTRENSTEWTNSLYAYNNVQADLNGVRASEGVGYFVHKLEAGEYDLFNKATLSFAGKFLSEKGVYQVEVSADGENYKTAIYQNAQTGRFDYAQNIDAYVRGCKDLYIRVLIKDVLIRKMNISTATVQTVKTDKAFSYDYDYSTYPDSNNANYASWTVDGAYEQYMTVLSNNLLGGGTGGKRGGGSYLVYRIDSGADNRKLKSLQLDLNISVTDLYLDCEDYDFSYDNGDWVLKVWFSLDGENYELVNTRYNDEIEEGETETLWETQDLTAKAKDQKTCYIKVEYFGAGKLWSRVGLKDLTITGEYNSALKVEAEEEKVEHTYHLNGGEVVDGNYYAPVKVGYEFAGWYLEPDFSGEKQDLDKCKLQPKTFYAKWERADYKIYYILDGGVNADWNKDTVARNGFFVLEKATKAGKTFVGWYDANGKKYTEIRGENLTDDIVLYAVYTDEVIQEGCAGSISGTAVLAGLTALTACVFVCGKRKE